MSESRVSHDSAYKKLSVEESDRVEPRVVVTRVFKRGRPVLEHRCGVDDGVADEEPIGRVPEHSKSVSQSVYRLVS
jgi:hypothetical protein